MANKIIKKRDKFGEKTSANNIIREFLVSGEGQMFGDIFKHLANQGIKYSKKGLHLRLNKLIDTEIIEKKQEVGKSYATYHLKIKGSDYSSLGWWMKDGT